ncbi:MAG: ABC transporter permease [Candidatus Atribacteria bacterium]|nr:ABC transporter permease [Candidatus Atribacteria bacterium]
MKMKQDTDDFFLKKYSREKIALLISGKASFIALCSLIVIFSFSAHNFFSLSNLTNILDLSAILLLTSTAMTFVLMLGSIDLSVEGIAGLTGIVGALMVKNFSNSNDYGLLSIIICILIGAIFGLLNGIVFTKLKIPSFMTTLGLGAVATGVGILVTRGYPVIITDQSIRGLALTKLLGGVIPLLFVIAITINLLIWFVSERTILGRHVIAIGGDEAIVKDLGIKIDLVKIIVFAISGAMFGLAGMLLVARLGAGDIKNSIGLLFDAVAASLIGGIAITGGIGKIPHAAIGAITLTILRNGMVLLGISPYIQQGVVGTIIILTVAVTIERKKIGVIK